MIDMPSPGAARSFWLQEALADDPGEPAPPLERAPGRGRVHRRRRVRRAVDRDPAHGTGARPPDRVDRAGHRRRRRERPQRRLPLGVLVRHRCDRRALRRRAKGSATAWSRPPRSMRSARSRRANGIDCWFHKDGTMGVRSGEWQESFGDGLDVFRRLGITDRVELLSAEQTRARADSPRFLDGSFFDRRRRLSAGAAGARASPGGARAGRASLRTHAHDRPRPVAAGGGAHRARGHQGRPGGVDDGRLGRRRCAVPSELRRDRRLRRGDRADPTAAEGDRLDVARRDRATGASGSTTCARPTTAGS